MNNKVYKNKCLMDRVVIEIRQKTYDRKRIIDLYEQISILNDKLNMLESKQNECLSSKIRSSFLKCKKSIISTFQNMTKSRDVNDKKSSSDDLIYIEFHPNSNDVKNIIKSKKLERKIALL